MAYLDLLKDPRWQRKRLEIMQRDEWSCQWCGDKTKTLNVHHKAYRRGAKPWEYEADNLITLCCDCHDTVTRENDLIAATVAAFPPSGARDIRRLVEAYVNLPPRRTIEEILAFMAGNDDR